VWTRGAKVMCLTCEHWPVDGLGCARSHGAAVGGCRRYCAMGIWCHPFAVCDTWTPRKSDEERAEEDGRLF